MKIIRIIPDMRIPSITLVYTNGAEVTKNFSTISIARDYWAEQKKYLIRTPWNKIINVYEPEKVQNFDKWYVSVVQNNGDTRNVMFDSATQAIKYYNKKQLKINSK